MFSVFHFFADLANKREELATHQDNLESFPFAEKMFSCRQKGVFPDAAIRVNPDHTDNPLLQGGELLEVKDSKSYTVSSFNSTIPTGEKNIDGLTSIAKRMTENGDNPYALSVRPVYYLLRGQRNNRMKICLTHGSFFETLGVGALIASSFSQALKEAESGSSDSLTEKEREKLTNLLSQQHLFSTSRKVDKASVSLRFRIMTEARKEANIFNAIYYPKIIDNTLNLIVPVHGETEAERNPKINLINAAMKTAGVPKNAAIPFLIKHPFNGFFWVLQVPLP